MSSSTLYCGELASELTGRVASLVKRGDLMRAALVEPTMDRRRRILDTILEYVRENKRVVYGGHASNAALGNTVYPTEEEVTMADVEFYSPKPIVDISSLCDRLFADGHPYVQGKEAAHRGTFTISVSFVRVCDITYVPARVFNELPLLQNAGNSVAVIHPHVSVIDMMKMLCDPATSSWRLARILPRLLKIQEVYPLGSLVGEEEGVVETSDTKTLSSRAAAALDWARSRNDSVALIGDMNHRELTFVCTDYDTDCDAFFASMELSGVEGAGELSSREYRGFMDSVGKRTEVTGGGKQQSHPRITLVDARGRMVPCYKNDLGLCIATFEYAVMHTMSMLLLGQTRQVYAIEQVYKRKLAELLRGSRSTSIASGSLEDVLYIGSPLTDMHMHLENTKRPWFAYNPSKKSMSGFATFPACDGAPEKKRTKPQVKVLLPLQPLQVLQQLPSLATTLLPPPPPPPRSSTELTLPPGSLEETLTLPLPPVGDGVARSASEVEAEAEEAAATA